MARSIHTTRKTYSDLFRQTFKTEAEREERLEEVFRAKLRKREIKRNVYAERHNISVPLAATAVEAIPIEILDASEVVRYPVSGEEIREFLAILPTALYDGLSKIQLCLGKSYIDERDRADEERDPHTGRVCCETVPGVFSGSVLGVYFSETNLISLFAYVYNDEAIAALPFSRGVLDLYLRLHFFKTLLHELAHHHDSIQRVRRGRWLADRKWNRENYAERMEYEWTRLYAIPFLQKKYPQEANAIIAWIEKWGGLRVGLDFFAGDPRATERSGMQKLVIATDSAFESFVHGLVQLPEPTSAHQPRIKLAWELLCAREHELCIQVLDGLRPLESVEQLEVLECRGQALLFAEQIEEALRVADSMLALDGQNNAAWEVRARAAELNRQWETVLTLCDDWETKGRAGEREKSRLLMFRAVACCALGRIEEMDQWIGSYMVSDMKPKREQSVWNRVYLRAGKEKPKQGA